MLLTALRRLELAWLEIRLFHSSPGWAEPESLSLVGNELEHLPNLPGLSALTSSNVPKQQKRALLPMEAVHRSGQVPSLVTLDVRLCPGLWGADGLLCLADALHEARYAFGSKLTSFY